MKDTKVEAFREAVRQFTQLEKGLWRKPSQQFIAWLRAQRIPAWLSRHLASAGLTRDTHVGVAYFYAPRRMRKENEAYPQIGKHGLFQIGSAFDGDPLVVQLRRDPGAVGYLSHDALWRDREDREVLFLRVADSIGDYAQMASAIVDCPIDFYGTMPR